MHKTNTTMRVDSETLKAWNDHKEHGDITKICEATGKSAPTIRQAFAGVASHALVIAINAYFTKKRKASEKSKMALRQPIA